MAGPRCKECGAGDYEFAICPKRPHQQVNLGGHGWRTVPRRVRECIDADDAGEKLAALIRDAYGRHNASKETNLPEPGIL